MKLQFLAVCCLIVTSGKLKVNKIRRKRERRETSILQPEGEDEGRERLEVGIGNL